MATHAEADDTVPMPSCDAMAAITDLEARIQLMHDSALTPEAVSEAIRAGMTAAVASPEFWSASLKAIQSHAQSEAGGWLLGGIKSLLSRVFWAAVILGGIYVIGGPHATFVFIKSIFTGAAT